MSNIQQISLREQPQVLKNYAHFHAANDDKSWSLIEIFGVLLLAFCVCFTVLAIAIPGSLT